MINKESIKSSYDDIIDNLNSKAKLLAVSKYQSIEKIKYLASLGQVDFGENYYQELEQKAKEFDNLRWHFIGSLQSRKIKHIVKYVKSIQSVEKFEQLQKINRAAMDIGKKIDVFLQINIDNDLNKSGFKSDQEECIVDCINRSKDFQNTEIIGFMCIPAKSTNPAKSFEKMKVFFDQINSKLPEELKLTRLSMGMSADYKLALEFGSTDVRIGSSLFGERLNSSNLT